MSAARELLDDLAVIGATVEPAGDRLILRAGHVAIPARLVNRVREAKADLIATLARHDAQPQRCLLGDRGPRFIRDLQTLIEDLLDVIGRPDDGIDHILVNGVRETMLYPGKSDHSLAAMGVVAQTACDVVANLNLHCGLAEVDVAAVAQLKAHHVLHDAVKPLAATEGKPIRGDS